MTLREALKQLLDERADETPQNVENQVLADYMHNCMNVLGHAVAENDRLIDEDRRSSSQ